MRADLIRLIHVARRSLRLDDETYRTFLSTVIPGKTSCRDMNVQELKKVINAMEEKGFKSTSRKSARRLSKPSGLILKIRIVWKTMFKDGFIHDGSDRALDGYVQRQTRLRNGGEGVASLEWLRSDPAHNLLESLKQWHIREMKNAMSQRGIHIPLSGRTGGESRDYDTLCGAYQQASKRWTS